jgi:hypothetical protein
MTKLFNEHIRIQGLVDRLAKKSKMDAAELVMYHKGKMEVGNVDGCILFDALIVAYLNETEDIVQDKKGIDIVIVEIVECGDKVVQWKMDIVIAGQGKPHTMDDLPLGRVAGRISSDFDALCDNLERGIIRSAAVFRILYVRGQWMDAV